MIPQPLSLPGEYTVATSPSAASYKGKLIWVTDRPGGAGPMISDGTAWRFLAPGKRPEVFTGSTNGSGLFSGTFSAAYSAPPAMSLERAPTADPAVVLRLTALSTTAFTVIAERRATLTVLGLDVLASALTPAASQAVSVISVGD